MGHKCLEVFAASKGRRVIKRKNWVAERADLSLYCIVVNGLHVSDKFQAVLRMGLQIRANPR
jgi:hypothetical protein